MGNASGGTYGCEPASCSSGATPHLEAVIGALPDADLVVAADSGYDHAVAAGVDVDVLVGDLDSISQDGRRRATADGIRIERHRPDKDETDTELALRAAMDDGCRRIVGVSAVGDRIDHFLATVAVFAGAAAQGGTSVTLWVSSTRIEFATPARSVELLSPRGAVHRPRPGRVRRWSRHRWSPLPPRRRVPLPRLGPRHLQRESAGRVDSSVGHGRNRARHRPADRWRCPPVNRFLVLRRMLPAAIAATTLAAACGSSNPSTEDTAGDATPESLTLVAYSAFVRPGRARRSRRRRASTSRSSMPATPGRWSPKPC
ncbi:MAG: thiamine diphosphokinase [Ilumatobacteraceae bacterium]